MNPVPVRDAATVMLVRDGARGLEVFMVRRSLRLVFAGGAHVFPGGAVDSADREIGGDDGLAFRVAAVRECFEEAGFLLAVESGGGLVRLDNPVVAARFAEHRRRVGRGQSSLAEVCAAEALRLGVDRMHYVSRWITPEGAPRRFDTRFFVCAAPEGQTPLHDATETIAHEWVRPGDALERHTRGALDLMLPTQRSLEWLDRHRSAGAVLEAAASAAPEGHYQRG